MSESLSKEYMLRAIELAKKGEGRTNPNPLVGAVIVKNEKIIGQGWHHAYGDLHAEREALKDCYQKGENPEGATIYVTLEPCCHFGKQPPCTQAILESKIAHVVVGSRDPNPLVHGKGNAFLREHGILVDEDFLRSKKIEDLKMFSASALTKLCEKKEFSYCNRVLKKVLKKEADKEAAEVDGPF